MALGAHSTRPLSTTADITTVRAKAIVIALAICAAGCAFGCGVVLGTAAEAKGARWTATSTTAMAITGDIEVSADRIKFGNGAAVGLNPTGVPEVFSLHPPGVNPVLLQGNRLCGETPPTYVTLYRKGRSLALTVFDGTAMPKTPTDLVTMAPGMCASYFYER